MYFLKTINKINKIKQSLRISFRLRLYDCGKHLSTVFISKNKKGKMRITNTTTIFHAVIVLISINDVPLPGVDGFTVPQTRQRHGRFTTRFSMVAVDPSQSSFVKNNESYYDREEIDTDYTDEFDEEDDDIEYQQNQQPIRRYKANKKEPILAILGRPNVGMFV